GTMANRLAEHGRRHAPRRLPRETKRERAADAESQGEELRNAQVVHQGELIAREGAPRVVGLHGAGRLATVGVALVHRDEVEVVLEDLQRVERRPRAPVAERRVQPAWSEQQKRIAGACFLVADAHWTVFEEWHTSPPF